MFVTDQIIRILQEVCLRQKMDLSGELIQALDLSTREYQANEFTEFKRDLVEAGYKAHLQMLEYSLTGPELRDFIKDSDHTLILFRKEREGYIPQLLWAKGKAFTLTSFTLKGNIDLPFSEVEFIGDYQENGEIKFISAIKLENIVSPEEEKPDTVPTPMWRFMKLLLSERKDILYIFFYAIIVGLISLVLPLGIQTTMELISGGLFFSSVYILIGGVIMGVLIAGGLQIVQITLVEYLQRRVFTKAAFEFAYRLPRIKLDAVDNSYPPQLINRFFDVMTIQKGLPKFLIEFAGAVIQILFGLTLLSLYHPFFVFFGLTLLGVLMLIFYLMGPQGLKTSIMESKYKYQVVNWLEDLGRSLYGFKMTGSTNLPIRKTDYFVNNYLKNRKNHFIILLKQFGAIVLFKALVIGGLLIIGTALVVAREITLGQFVASEVIIILILTSVEKIIMYTDVVYDLLTAVDKVGTVTDLQLEKRGGMDMSPEDFSRPFGINVRKLSFKHIGQGANTLTDINFDIMPGENVCVSGTAGSGKTTLIHLISGLLPNFSGSININQYSLRDLDLIFYRDRVSGNGSSEDIFEGTWIENIAVGNPHININAVRKAIQSVGLYDEVGLLPEGLETKIISGGKGLSSSTIQKILLARCLAKEPRLLILQDHFSYLSAKEKAVVLSELVSNKQKTMLIVSNDPMVMAACDKIILLEGGVLKAVGPYKELLTAGALQNCIDSTIH
jgi:ABC-type bacteriocin/lantibiotic exporter with double-glycine peptidase domain